MGEVRDVYGKMRDGLDEEVAKAVDVPVWAREQEPTTGGSRRRRRRSISLRVKLGSVIPGGGSKPYGIGT